MCLQEAMCQRNNSNNDIVEMQADAARVTRPENSRCLLGRSLWYCLCIQSETSEALIATCIKQLATYHSVILCCLFPCRYIMNCQVYPHYGSSIHFCLWEERLLINGLLNCLHSCKKENTDLSTQLFSISSHTLMVTFHSQLTHGFVWCPWAVSFWRSSVLHLYKGDLQYTQYTACNKVAFKSLQMCIVWLTNCLANKSQTANKTPPNICLAVRMK